MSRKRLVAERKVLLAMIAEHPNDQLLRDDLAEVDAELNHLDAEDAAEQFEALQERRDFPY